ncbi:MAG: DUF1552 domain-containing protein [Bryobacterales bacterium]|nr:DUF1552 domain-containing protein [Bryobacterales bacterium]
MVRCKWVSGVIFGKHLERRAVLRGFGATIALPFLDSMVPAFGAARSESAEPPRRLAFVYIPNGVIQEAWTPGIEGRKYDFPRILKPLEAHREDLLVFSGLTQNNGRALGDGPGDHARAAASFLTGIHPKKTSGADIRLGMSVDQVAARAVGDRTRFASIELGIEPGRLAGNCDSGYSCAYSNSISWRGEKTPNPPEIDPTAVFERMFGDVERPLSPGERKRRESRQRSVLDHVLGDANRLRGSVGPADRQKLDEYLESVRDVEKRLSSPGASLAVAPPSMERPDGIPAKYADHARLMFDLTTLAFQTDQTRIATFMMGREGSNLTYPEIGVTRAHHGMTHHRGDPDKIEDITKVNEHHVEQFAYFVSKLASIEEADGRLLDNSMVVYGSGIGDGNRHTHHDLPVLVAGKAGGTLSTGRHLRYAAETPMNNLFMSLLDRVGVRPETLGDATGKLDRLSFG